MLTPAAMFVYMTAKPTPFLPDREMLINLRVHKTREIFEKVKKITYWGSILPQTVECSIMTPKLYLYEAIYNHVLPTNAAVCIRNVNSFNQKTLFAVRFNPLNAELNPICYLLALLEAHHFLHVSRIRVKLLTFRLLMSYIYGAPILDVSRSHTTTQHSR